MRRFRLLVLTLMTVVTAGSSLTGTASAASSYTGYYGSNIPGGQWFCNVLGELDDGVTQDNCVDSSGKVHQKDAMTFLQASACPTNNSDCLKNNFIDYIKNVLLGGSTTELEHVGATFIVNTMRGENAGKDIYPNGANKDVYKDWVDRIKNPAVTLQIVNSYPYDTNTAFDPRTDDVLRYDDKDAAASLVFYYNGAASYAIRLQCGNPVGATGGGGFQPLPLNPSPSGASVAPAPNEHSPTLVVTGGDVLTGATFNVSDGSGPAACGAPDTNAGITSWNHKGSPDWNGAGEDLAAYTLSYIQEFKTGQVSGVPEKLAFSNANDTTTGSSASLDPPNGYFGGMFGTINACVPFWQDMPAKKTTLTNPNLNIDSIGDKGDQSYWFSGGTLRILGGHITNGNHIFVYVDGDVHITNDITYLSNTWADNRDIPTFTLVVHGRIVIDGSVGELDGTYVAVPDAGYNPTKANNFTDAPDGTISTCADGDVSYDPTAISKNGYLADCTKTPLNVYGSFVANQIWLLRGYGDLAGDGSGRHAENFHYGPEVWLAPAGGTIGASGYDSAIGLPPVL